MNVTVRRLGVGDALAVRTLRLAARTLRLAALRLFPDNFGSAWEEEAQQPFAFWENRLRGPARTLGAESDGKLVGIASVSPNSRVKLAHTVEIGGFYVQPEFHRRGVGRALMQSVMELLRSNEFPTPVKFATLTVVADNEAARRLYESFGFGVCGKFEHQLCVGGIYHDELIMRARIA